MLGGAEDGRTPAFDLGWKEGVRRERVVGQGSKLGALDIAAIPELHLTKEVIKVFGVPSEVPLGIYSVGGLIIATLPGEFTYTAGHRVRSALAAASGRADASHVLLVGLGNEYLSYFATPEEYDSQQYEGASTGWGTLSLPIVAEALVDLYAGGASARLPRDYHYEAGVSHHYSIADIGAEPARADDGLSNILADASGAPKRDYPRVAWIDNLPDLSKGLTTPRVLIERRVGGEWAPLQIAGREETDEGVNFVTIALGSTKASSRWAAFWIVPSGLPPDAELRFALRTLGRGRLCSAPFGPSDVFDQGLAAYPATPCQ